MRFGIRIQDWGIWNWVDAGYWKTEDRGQKTENRLSGYLKIRVQVIRKAGYQVKEQKAKDRGANGQSELVNW